MASPNNQHVIELRLHDDRVEICNLPSGYAISLTDLRTQDAAHAGCVTDGDMAASLARRICEISDTLPMPAFNRLKGQYARIAHSLHELSTLMPEAAPIIALPSVRAVLSAHYATGKAIQPGRLYECAVASLLAQGLGCDDGWEATDFPDDAPAKLIGIVGTDILKGALFAFYDEEGEEAVVQYGGPLYGDIRFFSRQGMVKVEVKEPKAKLGEYDIALTDDGRLAGIVDSENKRDMAKAAQPCIDRFNEENATLLSHLGSNHPLVSGEVRTMATAYMEMNGNDLLISTNAKGRLVPILPEMIEWRADDGMGYVISTKGSEIRPKGRNHRSVSVSQQDLRAARRILGAPVDGTADIVVVKVDEATFKLTKPRGTGKDFYNRMYLADNSTMFVFCDKVSLVDAAGTSATEDDPLRYGATVSFDIRDMRRLRPSISAHIDCTAIELEAIARHLSGDEGQP